MGCAESTETGSKKISPEKKSKSQSKKLIIINEE